MAETQEMIEAIDRYALAKKTFDAAETLYYLLDEDVAASLGSLMCDLHNKLCRERATVMAFMKAGNSP